MTIWTALALTVNAVSIFFVYYECAFRMFAFTSFSAQQFIFEIILIIEVMVFFFKAYPAKETCRGWLFPVVFGCGGCKKIQNIDKYDDRNEKKSFFETSFLKIGVRYLSGAFIIDFLSVVPFFIAKLVFVNDDYIDFVQKPFILFLGYLRLLRITQLPKILAASEVYAQLAIIRFPLQR